MSFFICGTTPKIHNISYFSYHAAIAPVAPSLDTDFLRWWEVEPMTGERQSRDSAPQETLSCTWLRRFCPSAETGDDGSDISSLGKSASSPSLLPSSVVFSLFLSFFFFFLFFTSITRLRTGGVLAWVHIDARKRRPKLIKCWKWGLCSERWSHGTRPQSLDGK